MAAKKTKAKSKQVTVRLDGAELAAADADRKQLGGIPVSLSRYAKHAVTSYPKLRKLRDHVARMAKEGYSEDIWRAAEEFLAEAGL